MGSAFQLFVIVALFSSTSRQEELQCPFLTEDQIPDLVNRTLLKINPGQTAESITVFRARVTAVALGTVKDRYREAAIAVKFNSSLNATNQTLHIIADCTGSLDYEIDIPESVLSVSTSGNCRTVAILNESESEMVDYNSTSKCLREFMNAI